MAFQMPDDSNRAVTQLHGRELLIKEGQELGTVSLVKENRGLEFLGYSLTVRCDGLTETY